MIEIAYFIKIKNIFSNLQQVPLLTDGSRAPDCAPAGVLLAEFGPASSCTAVQWCRISRLYTYIPCIINKYAFPFASDAVREKLVAHIIISSDLFIMSACVLVFEVSPQEVAPKTLTFTSRRVRYTGCETATDIYIYILYESRATQRDATRPIRYTYYYCYLYRCIVLYYIIVSCDVPIYVLRYAYMCV